jgi:hypothetical protein
MTVQTDRWMLPDPFEYPVIASLLWIEHYGHRQSLVGGGEYELRNASAWYVVSALRSTTTMYVTA